MSAMAYSGESKEQYLKRVIGHIKAYLMDKDETYGRIMVYFEKGKEHQTKCWSWLTPTRKHEPNFSLETPSPLFCKCANCGCMSKELEVWCEKEPIKAKYCYNCGHEFIRR